MKLITIVSNGLRTHSLRHGTVENQLGNPASLAKLCLAGDYTVSINKLF